MNNQGIYALKEKKRMFNKRLLIFTLSIAILLALYVPIVSAGSHTFFSRGIMGDIIEVLNEEVTVPPWAPDETDTTRAKLGLVLSYWLALFSILWVIVDGIKLFRESGKQGAVKWAAFFLAAVIVWGTSFVPNMIQLWDFFADLWFLILLVGLTWISWGLLSKFMGIGSGMGVDTAGKLAGKVRGALKSEDESQAEHAKSQAAVDKAKRDAKVIKKGIKQEEDAIDAAEELVKKDIDLEKDTEEQINDLLGLLQNIGTISDDKKIAHFKAAFSTLASKVAANIRNFAGDTERIEGYHERINRIEHINSKAITDELHLIEQTGTVDQWTKEDKQRHDMLNRIVRKAARLIQQKTPLKRRVDATLARMTQINTETYAGYISSAADSIDRGGSLSIARAKLESALSTSHTHDLLLKEIFGLDEQIRDLDDRMQELENDLTRI